MYLNVVNFVRLGVVGWYKGCVCGVFCGGNIDLKNIRRLLVCVYDDFFNNFNIYNEMW